MARLLKGPLRVVLDHWLLARPRRSEPSRRRKELRIGRCRLAVVLLWTNFPAVAGADIAQSDTRRSCRPTHEKLCKETVYKHAVKGFSDALLTQAGPRGIKVTCVAPGPFRTDWASRSLA